MLSMHSRGLIFFLFLFLGFWGWGDLFISFLFPMWYPCVPIMFSKGPPHPQCGLQDGPKNTSILSEFYPRTRVPIVIHINYFINYTH